MKHLFSLVIFIISSSFIYSQGKCELFLKDGKLTGKCEKSYFTHFEIPLNVNKLDGSTLFNLLPLKGNVLTSNDLNLDLRFESTNRAGFPQVIFKTNSWGWYTMDSLLVDGYKITFTIDHDPKVPITESDFKIIKKTKELLTNKDSWHKNDDRECEDDIKNNRYSLFCALKSASIKVEGAYNHRNAIMQKIRHTIVKMYPNKKWRHRLLDFNNMVETDFTVLMDLLNRVEREVISELK